MVDHCRERTRGQSKQPLETAGILLEQTAGSFIATSIESCVLPSFARIKTKERTSNLTVDQEADIETADRMFAELFEQRRCISRLVRR
jgi:hypothetical protein